MWGGMTEYLTEDNSFPVQVDGMAPVPEGPFKVHQSLCWWCTHCSKLTRRCLVPFTMARATTWGSPPLSTFASACSKCTRTRTKPSRLVDELVKTWCRSTLCVAAARAAGTPRVGLVHKCHQRRSLLGVCCGCQVPPEAGCQVYLTPHGPHR